MREEFLGSNVDCYLKSFSLIVPHKCYRKKKIRAIFDEGRISLFQCGLLPQSFSLIVPHKCYKKKGIRANFDEGRVSWFQCGFLNQDCSFIVLHRCYKKKKGVVRILMGQDSSWFQCGVLMKIFPRFCLHKRYKRKEVGRASNGLKFLPPLPS